MTKKVKAPLTYNPGKGRPKEHLAYLNYQEMQALKRLNGNNQERGPKGLPSFPPADAMGSSSKASSSKSSTKSSASKTTTKSSGADNKYSPRSGYRGTGSPTTGSIRGSAYGRFGGPADKQGGGDRGTKAPSGGRTGFSGGAKASADAKAKAEAASRDSVKIARESPAYKSDVKKGGISAIPSRSYSQVFDKQPGKIKGAIESVAEQAKKPSGVPSQASRIAREGPFGAPAYSGSYNPATGRYDATPKVAAKPAGFNKYEALAAYKGPFGPELAAAVGSPIERAMTGRYDKLAAYKGPFGPELTAAVGSPIERAMTGRYDKLAAYKGPFGPEMAAAVGSPVEKALLSGRPLERFGPEPQKLDLAEINARLNQYEQEIKDLDRRDITTFDEPRYNTEQTLRAYEAAKRAAPTSKPTEITIPGGGLPVQEKNTTVVGGPYTKGYDRALIAERVAKQRMAYDTPPATVDRLKAAFGAAEYDKKLNKENVQPMGYEQPGEKVLAVENVPEAGIAGLVGAEAKAAAKKAGIPASVYNSPGFLDDVDRLGITGAVQENISPTDMAKLHARAYGGQYLTPAEKAQAMVSTGVEKVVLGGANMALPGTSTAVKQTKKAMGIETPKEFLSRPSYEQSYLRDVARAENVRMGRDPLGRTSYTTADGQTVQRTGPSFGQGGDRGGIASLTVPTPTVAPAPTESTTGTTQMGGPRPYIHFQWDLGLNIPKPTDPNYPDYQRYLANRAASAAAIEGA